MELKKRVRNSFINTSSNRMRPLSIIYYRGFPCSSPDLNEKVEGLLDYPITDEEFEAAMNKLKAKKKKLRVSIIY